MPVHESFTTISQSTTCNEAKRLSLGSQFNNYYLTKREKEIAEYVVIGHTAKQIGQLLNISFRTVETYIDKLKMKLGCNNKRDIAKAIIRSSIIYQLDVLRK